MKGMLLSAAEKYGIPLQVNHFGSMINPFFTDQEVQDFKSAQSSDTDKFSIFFWKMMEHGVFLPPSQFESWFLMTEIDKEDMKTIENAIEAAMEAVAEKSKK